MAKQDESETPDVTASENPGVEAPPARKSAAKKAPAKKAPAVKAPPVKAPTPKAPVQPRPEPEAERTGKRAAAARTARSVTRAASMVADAAGAAVDSVAEGARGPDDPNVIAPRRLSGFDFATWRSAANDPVMRSPMIGLVALSSPPDWKRLVARFDRASRVAPILRQRIVEGPTDIISPRLIVDAEFDLSFHMRRYRVPDPGSWAQVLDETRRQSMADFDPARPLWRVTILEGLKDGGAVMILKLHHAIADGQGAMMLGATIFDMTAEELDLGPIPPAPIPTSMDAAAFLGSAVADASSLLTRGARDAADAAIPFAMRALTDPSGAIEDVLNVVKSMGKFIALPSRPMSPVMVGRSINYHFTTFDVPMAELKNAAKSHGLSLNDAFLGGVTGGLRLYHELRDEPVAYLRCNMPISLRDPDRPAQNAVTIARFEVPVGIVDPVERMAALRELVTSWRAEPALHLIDPLAEVSMRLLPPDVVTSAAQKSDFTASNVPGVPVPVYIAGAKVVAMYPLMSTVGAATNITLLSYAGNAGIGISMDDAAIPDRKDFIECMCQGFAEVIGRPVTPSDPFA